MEPTFFKCADCGVDAFMEEILQTHLGRVCDNCFELMQARADSNRNKFSYKFKNFLNKWL